MAESQNNDGRRSAADLDADLLGNQSREPESQLKDKAPAASGQELSEIDLDLFNRLLKTGVLKANPSIKTMHDKKKVLLDQVSTERYYNGTIFGKYLLVLKEVLQKENQDLSVDPALAQTLKDQSNAQSRLFNWNYLCNELEVSSIKIITASENWNYCRE